MTARVEFVTIHVSRRRDGDQQAQISHDFLTNLVGRHRTQVSMLGNRWTMTCEYGLQRTGRTLSIDLLLRRLGVRVSPSAPRSQALCPPGDGFSCRFGSHAGSHGHTSAPEQARLIDSAARLSSSSRCPYTSLVTAMLACPSTSETTCSSRAKEYEKFPGPSASRPTAEDEPVI